MITVEQVSQLLMALLVGGIIGAEREYRSKSAGFRTMMLISIGACLYTMLSPIIGSSVAPERIASNIVVGIGFVGAGVIFKGSDRTHGLTTAASIWVTAALGMAVGAGHPWFALVATGIVFVVMAFLPKLEVIIDRVNLQRTYHLVTHTHHGDLHHIEVMLKAARLHYKINTHRRANGTVESSWYVEGPQKRHLSLVEKLMHDERILEFRY